MANADLGDVTIYYEEMGSGPLAYVFCHGGGGTGQVFVEHFPFWQEHFPRVVTWDNRGMGTQTHPLFFMIRLIILSSFTVSSTICP